MLFIEKPSVTNAIIAAVLGLLLISCSETPSRASDEMKELAPPSNWDSLTEQTRDTDHQTRVVDNKWGMVIPSPLESLLFESINNNYQIKANAFKVSQALADYYLADGH